MSVQSAMTGIANRIRVLLGLSGTMGLSGMENNLGVIQNKVDEQANLISQIRAALENKTSGVITPSGDINITENGNYDVTKYARAVVDVPTPEPVIQPLTVTENGTFTAADGVDGYSPVTVNVPSLGGSAQSATGTMAGSGSNDMSFSVDFEPDLVCVCVSDLNAMQANAHMAGAIIVRDLFAQCAYRRASTTAFSNGSFGYDVTGLVRSTALQASYSGGVCTVHAVQGSYKFISDCEYTWIAIKF